MNRSPSPRSMIPAIVTSLFAVVVLVPSLWGFSGKFREFIAIYRGDVDGVFAITPIVNYLLASLGFFCLFGWAIFHGMFSDIEQPKHALLEREVLLDEVMETQRTEDQHVAD
jgi:hypothetical protein